jgi:Cu+-exporting ATPase
LFLFRAFSIDLESGIFGASVTHLFNLLTVVPFLSSASSIYSGTVLLIVAAAFAATAIERKSRTRTARKLASLKELRPTTLRISQDGRESFENVDTLQLGGSFIVRAGERFPTDGIIEEGSSQVDESIWTGDPSPPAKLSPPAHSTWKTRSTFALLTFLPNLLSAVRLPPWNGPSLAAWGSTPGLIA